MLDREFWVGRGEGREGPVGSEGEVRKNANSRNSLLTTAASTQISNNIKQQKKNRHMQTKQPEQAFMCAWGWRIYKVLLPCLYAEVSIFAHTFLRLWLF